MARSMVSRLHSSPLSTIAPERPVPPVGIGAGRRRVPDVRPFLGIRSAAGLSAWMIVMPVDALALVAPAVWAPQHAKGFIAVALLGLVLLTDGGRYRARLHVSVLDELPFILGRLLAAGAIVATAFALLHEPKEIATFLAVGLSGIGLVLVGRMITNQIVLLGRRRRMVVHRTDNRLRSFAGAFRSNIRRGMTSPSTGCRSPDHFSRPPFASRHGSTRSS